jgi:hypothetical protein
MGSGAMAIVPIHKTITKDALEDFGFTPQAIAIAAEANAAVDEKQGDDASETNLHAMAGYFLDPDPIFGRLNIRLGQQQPLTSFGMQNTLRAPPGVTGTQSPPTGISLGPLNLAPDPLSSMSKGYRLQTKKETEDAVKALLGKAKGDIVQSALRYDYAGALKRLGEALHTIQDRVFHHFEPWPYKDIPDSLMKSPNYMMCHALRDLGYISKIGADEHQFALGVATRVDPQLYLGLEAFAPIGDQNSMTGGFRGWGSMITLSYGAAPGSMRPPGQSGGSGAQGPDDAIQSCLATEGVADKAEATDDSKQFIEEVKEEIEKAPSGTDIWDKLKRGS